MIWLHELAADAYLVASLAAVLALALPEPRAARVGAWALGVGALLHGAAFATLHRLATPPPLTSLPAAVSLMAWLAVLFALFLLRRGRFETLAGLVAPFAFLAVLWASVALEHAAPAPAGAAGGWPHLHVILASAGFALLGVAGLAGLLFLVEARALKAKRTPRLRLPSLEALDRVNLLALAIGFPLLTFAVLAGMIWTQGMTGRLWAGGAHAIWTTVAWGVYLLLVVARFGVGWRGRDAAASAALGFGILLFAVLGARTLP